MTILVNPITLAIISAIVSGIVSYVLGIKKEKRKQIDSWESRISDMETTLNGQEGTDIIKGVTELVTMHDDEISEINERLDRMEDRVERLSEIRTQIDNVMKKCKERNGEGNV